MGVLDLPLKYMVTLVIGHVTIRLARCRFL